MIGYLGTIENVCSMIFPQNTGVWSELLNDARRRKKYHEIPEKYNFQTVADLLIVKKPKLVEPEPPKIQRKPGKPGKPAHV